VLLKAARCGNVRLRVAQFWQISGKDPCGLYFGIDAARFCSALGWGNTALTAGLILYWAAAVGVAAQLGVVGPSPRTAR
jgi:tetrahydromethanopterin S-methyltransferase subunit E